MKIGILQTGYAPDELRPETGDYPSMFARLLDGHGFSFQTWPVLDMVFPDGPDDADGWLITGSKFGAYEDHEWIPPLEQLVRDIRASGKPLVGICFGHQIIAQALGGKVEKFSGGWAVGRQEYDYTDGSRVALNAWHQDQVTERPAEAQVVASNPFCENAALLYGEHAYTVQAHPEFEADFIDGLLRTRGKGVVPPDLSDRARADLTKPIRNDILAQQIARFFKEKRIA